MGMKKLMRIWTMNEEARFRGVAFALVLAVGLCLTTTVARASDESDVRSVVQQVFQQSTIPCPHQPAAALRAIASPTL